ncbi:XK-related protein 8 [Gymnodraco acuticeps]|uniref:XK-related protein n=1 Tax=Gymnodraco acuticeps TaxID=8218 RepID=A0A6P8W161_GYMAC|nr:XK-related protein 8 [Gymnodraco acuticeps]
MGKFKFSPLDISLMFLGLVFLVVDIVLDVLAVVNFYQEKSYVSLSVLILLLVGSSLLVQAFSWLWYRYEESERDQEEKSMNQTKVEKCLSRSHMKLLHVLQLGIYFRHAGVVEMSLCSAYSQVKDSEGFAVYMIHDLSMLRLIETFSESAPQLVLMITIMLQGQLDPITVLKAVGSMSAIALSVTMYHRSMRSFLPDKEKQQLISSVVYFLWNLLLISSRLTALALFASVLPCFIFTHFLCSWLVLFFFLWRSKTDFMSSPCGEWLYRATVALIWYFDWFNALKGRTRYKTMVYHGYILVDISVLCSLWCWKMITDTPLFEVQLHAVIAAVTVVAVYILGLVFKMIYYRCYHPNLSKEELKGDDTKGPPVDEQRLMICEIPSEDVVDLSIDDLEEDNVRFRDLNDEDRSIPAQPAPEIKRCNKRMRKLAENFYS